MSSVTAVLSNDLLFCDHVAPFLELRTGDVLLVDRARTALRLLTSSERLRNTHALVLFYMDREIQDRTSTAGSEGFESGMARHFPCKGCPYGEPGKTYTVTLPSAAISVLGATVYDWSLYVRFMACYDIECVFNMLDSGAVELCLGVSSYNWVVTYYNSVSPRWPTTSAIATPLVLPSKLEGGDTIFPTREVAAMVRLPKLSHARVVYGASEVQQLEFLHCIARGPLLELYVTAVMDPDALGTMHLVFSDIYVPTNEEDMDALADFMRDYVSAVPSVLSHLSATTNCLAPSFTGVVNGGNVVSSHDTCVSVRVVLSDWFRPRFYHLIRVAFDMYQLYAPCFTRSWPATIAEGYFLEDESLLDTVEFMSHLIQGHEYMLRHLVRDRTSVRMQLTELATTQTMIMPTVAYFLQLVGMVFPLALSPTHLAASLPAHVTPAFFPGYPNYHQFSFFATGEVNIRDLAYPPSTQSYDFAHLNRMSALRSCLVPSMSQRIQLHGDIIMVRHAKFVSDQFYYQVPLTPREYKWRKLPEIRRKRPIGLI